MAFWRILLPTKCQKLILINTSSCPRRLESSSTNFFKKHAISVLNRSIFLYSLTQSLVVPDLALQNSITVIYRKPQSGTHIVLFHYMDVFHLHSTEICLYSSPSSALLHSATEHTTLPWRGMSGKRHVVYCRRAGTGVIQIERISVVCREEWRNTWQGTAVIILRDTCNRRIHLYS
jgi:hypothetical protein